MSNGDTTEVTLPDSIVIPDGETTSAEFVITALNDGLEDGAQDVPLASSAAGYVDGTEEIEVTDFVSWQSPTHPCDVNLDGFITPLDALLIINDLNMNESRQLPIPYPDDYTPPPFLDVSGDNIVAPQDAVIVINYINEFGSGLIPPAGEGEGEAEGESDAGFNRIVTSDSVDSESKTDAAAVVVQNEPIGRGFRTRGPESGDEQSRLAGADSPLRSRDFLTGFERDDISNDRDDLPQRRAKLLGDDDLEKILECIADDIDEAWWS